MLEKKLLLAEVESKLNAYVPANTVKQIIVDMSETLQNYEVKYIFPDGGQAGRGESEQLIGLYLDAKRIEGKSPNTITHYGYKLRRLLEGVQVPVSKITVYHIRKYMMDERGRGISMTTIKSDSCVYTAFFSWLFNEGLIEKNPTANLGTVKAHKEEELPFTGEEIQLIKESAENDCERAIIHFLLSTGCRISETCSVNRSDIDYSNLCLKVLGKGDKFRSVYIDNVTAMMLRRYLATRNDIDPALFYSQRSGQRYTDDGIRVMLKRIEERSHVPVIHPHRFRHTLATNLIDRGISIQEVASILGHANINTTMTYVHVNQRNAENAYRKYACM